MELLEILRGAHGGVGGCVSSGRVRAAYSNRPGEKITLAINVIMRLMRRLGAGVPIMTSYANIRVVLVGTTHPGNIGAAARAMKNMCLEPLWLVQPKIFPHAEATARASGADDVLARARVVETLEEALQEFNSSAGVLYAEPDYEVTIDVNEVGDYEETNDVCCSY